MFHLWTLAEQDLLNENVPYRLRDTGQGLNRVQAAPKTSRMMHAILNRAQRSIGSWVGSSVIHMGDHNVPNALMFIGRSSPLADAVIRPSADPHLSSVPHPSASVTQTNTPRCTAYCSRSAIPSRSSLVWSRTRRSDRTSTTNGDRLRGSVARSWRTSSATGLTAPVLVTTSTRVRGSSQPVDRRDLITLLFQVHVSTDG